MILRSETVPFATPLATLPLMVQKTPSLLSQYEASSVDVDHAALAQPSELLTVPSKRGARDAERSFESEPFLTSAPASMDSIVSTLLS